MEFLSQRPFNLGAPMIKQVRETYEKLDLKARIGQLFTLLLLGDDPADLDVVLSFQPGGVTRFFGPDLAHERSVMERIAAALPIPPLVSADLEGSRQSLSFGTVVPNQIGLAAIDDVAVTTQMAGITAREAKAMGVRWSFTPVVDINAAFRSAIVATRSFGSDVDRIERHAIGQIEALQANGVAATVKHWPGEGYDDRDQHLVTTVNPLEREAWELTFGRVYRAAFDAGVLSVMAAHIAAPQIVRAYHPDAGIEAYRPASISHLLTTTLLRDELGFNGVVVSDATEMAGLGAWIGEPEAAPAILAAGCDMILFSRDPERDRDEIIRALDDGRLSESRLEDAVLRVLGLKAVLGLLDDAPLIPAPEEQALLLGATVSQAAAAAAFERMPTLEKDVPGLLPLSVIEHRRVLVFEGEIRHPLLPEPPTFSLPDMMVQEGFEVTRFRPGMTISKDDFDLVLYLLGDESLLTRNRIFIDWAKLAGGGIGGALRRYWHDIPTMMISFGHPYHLYDAPRVPTYANGWSTLDVSQSAMLDCLRGRKPWRGGRPVDAFCGLEDARW